MLLYDMLNVPLILFCVCVVCAGVGGAAVFTSGYIIVSRYFVKKKGRAMALGTLGSGLGNVVLSPLLGLLIHEYTLSGAMLIMSALMAHNFLSGALYRPVAPSPPVGVEGGGKWRAEGEQGGVLRQYYSLLRSPLFLLYSGQMVCMQACIQVYLIFLPALAVSGGASVQLAAVTPAVLGAADMLGRLAFGIVFDLRAVRPRRPLLHAGLAVLFGLLAACTALTSRFTGVAALAAAVGLAESGVHSQRMTVVADLVLPSRLSAAISLTIFCQGVGNLIGPPVAGTTPSRLLQKFTIRRYPICLEAAISSK